MTGGRSRQRAGSSPPRARSGSTSLVGTDFRIADEARDAPVMTGSFLVLRSAEGEDVGLPADLQHVLLNTIASIADDREITIGRMPEELTSTAAADLLGISRPTLIKWARSGAIASLAADTRTRFRRDEVMRVRARRARKRAGALEALREFDAEHETDLGADLMDPAMLDSNTLPRLDICHVTRDRTLRRGQGSNGVGLTG